MPILPAAGRVARLAFGSILALVSCEPPEDAGDTGDTAEPASEDAEPARAWAPPPWIPEGGPVSPWALEVLDREPLYDEGPELRSRSAFIADLDRGEVLFARDADIVYPVASLTKLVSALTLAAEGPELDETLCVGPEQYPTRSGARSKFETDVCHPGWDYLGAALVSSDNRGAMGLPALTDLHYDGFIDRMHDVGHELGMERARWADPSGIEIGNQASARDMARAVTAVAAHPDLQPIASAPVWTIERDYGLQMLSSTNRLVDRWETLAAKTGYTDPAGYCFAQVVRPEGGGTYAVVVMGAPTSGTRFAEVGRLVEWAEQLP